MNEREIEQLLRMSRELENFERELEIGVEIGVGIGAHKNAEPNWQLKLAEGRVKSAARKKWTVMAAAACLVIAAVARMMSTPTAPPTAPPTIPWVITAKHDDEPVVLNPFVPAVAQVSTDASKDSDTVHVVVALYRGDSAPTERCPECWCVARWSADWGEGRTVNELQDHELLEDSMLHACVNDPKRVVVVGLSGPAASMPKTDQQALEMSLCLMGLQGSAAPQSSVDTPNCMPTGVDYCLTAWGQ